jgi:peptide subunit release factor 1 (eRF1)
MISIRDLEQLMKRESKPGSPTLSVYLSTDPSRPANIRRSFEAVLYQMLRSIEGQLKEKPFRKQFAEDAGRVQQVVETHVPREKSLAIFCDTSEDFCWLRGLQVRLRDDAHWEESTYLRPLLEALDEQERYGVVLTEPGRSRLFTVYMGEIEEHVDAFAPAKVRSLTSTGTDHLLSQNQFQRKKEVHALWHLKHTAKLLDNLVMQCAFDRLVLAGTEEVTMEFERILPKRLRTRVVARITLPFIASAALVLQATQEVMAQIERESERELVDRLLRDAPAKNRAVTGLDATLLALQEQRIWRLIYVDGFQKTGGRCRSCGAFCTDHCQVCPFCGGTLSQVKDLIDASVQRVVEWGGKIEPVQEEAARMLAAAGSIGAQLRF